MSGDEDKEDEEEALVEKLSPPPRPVACLRAPCLKKTATLAGGCLTSGRESPMPSSSASSLSSSPESQQQESTTISFSSFAAPRSLPAAMPKRQVHFDAAPPEAGLTHSGDRYDRRPIECTQGGSAFDLSLPPRGALAQYAESEASDDTGEDGDEDEEGEMSKGLAGRLARWSKLKNGQVIASSKSSVAAASSAATGATTTSATSENACSVPVHGIRSFGGLAGQSGVAKEEAVWSSKKSVLRDEGDDDLDDDEYEARDEAFRRAVSAALSKSPNATPMPSPRVRPRWECVTSYFEDAQSNSAESQCLAAEESSSAPVSPQSEKAEALSPFSEDGSKSSPPTSPSLVSEVREEEDSHQDKSAEKGENEQVAEIDDDGEGMPTPKPQSKAVLDGKLQDNQSPPKESAQLPVSPNPSSLDGRTSLGGGSSSRSSSASNHPYSSPMSSRCSSTDAWSSSQGNCSTDDVFVSAFSEAVMNRPSLSTDNLRLASFSSNGAAQSKVHLSPPSGRDIDGDLDAEHERGATSSGSGSGGPGWMSSCCTSPELNPVDVDDVSGREGMASSLTAKAQLLQASPERQGLTFNGIASLIQPLRLQDREALSDSSSGEVEQKRRSCLLSRPRFGIKAASCPNSGHCSPRVQSSDEHDSEHQPGEDDEAAAAASFFFRSSSGASKLARNGSRTKKTRRCASSSSSNGCESEDQAGEAHTTRRSPRPTGAPRSKSMSCASMSASGSPRVRRTSQLSSVAMAKTDSSHFASDEIEDEGALGGF